MSIRSEIDQLPSGSMIRAARGLIGIEQAQLATQVGVSRKTIFSIERDNSLRPDERRTKIVRKIRDYFADECGVLFLFERDGLGEGVRLSKPDEKRPP
jgi:DNA-binding XRE family transcriptional regulator